MRDTIARKHKNINLLENLTEEQNQQLAEFNYSWNGLLAALLIILGVATIIFAWKYIWPLAAGVLLIGLGLLDILYLKKRTS